MYWMIVKVQRDGKNQRKFLITTVGNNERNVLITTGWQ
jgi:predicted type IV restriction endonuclease